MNIIPRYKCAVLCVRIVIACFCFGMCNSSLAQPYMISYPEHEPIPYTGIFKLGERTYRVGLQNIIEVSTNLGKTWSSLTPSVSRFNIIYAAASGDHALALLEPTMWAPLDWEDSTHTSLLLFTDDQIQPRLLEMPWFVETRGFYRRLHCDVTDDAFFVLQIWNDSVLVRSTDEGVSWERLSLPDTTRPLYLRFYDKDYGILIGYCESDYLLNQLSVYVTHDGAATWSRLDDVKAPLLTVDAQWIPPVCWLSRDSVLLRDSKNATLLSTNGGVSWTVQSENIGIPTIQDMVMHRNGRGYLSTDDGSIYRTDDLGRSWIPIRGKNYIQWGSLDHLCSRTPDELLLADDRGGASRTSDGGISWDVEKSQVWYYPQTLQVLSMDTVFARVRPTDRPSLYFSYLGTTDGGSNWKVCLEIDGEGRDWKDVHFATAYVWYALREPTDTDSTVVLRTTDAGASWKSVYSSSSCRFVRLPKGKISRGAEEFWFAANNGLFATSDGGKNWRSVRNGSDLFIPEHLDISFPPTCFMMRRGQFARSSDNGMTWEVIPEEPARWGWRFMVISDSLNIYIFCYDIDLGSYFIQRSSDAGFTWDTLDVVQSNIEFSFMQNDGRSIGISGNRLVSTENGWNSYHIEQEIFGPALWNIYSLDALNSWVTTSMTIMKTTNGGINWTNVTPSLPQSPRILSTWPQPVSQGGMMSTEVELTQPGPVRVELYDLLGRGRAVVLDAEVTATRRTVQWSTAGLERGVYVLRLVTGSGVANAKVIVE